MSGGDNIEREGKQEDTGSFKVVGIVLRINKNQLFELSGGARAHRYQEECLLLQEEMRRVLAYFENHETQWITVASRSYLRNLNDQALAGMHAYAHRQAALQRSFVRTCKEATEPYYNRTYKQYLPY